LFLGRGALLPKKFFIKSALLPETTLGRDTFLPEKREGCIPSQIFFQEGVHPFLLGRGDGLPGNPMINNSNLRHIQIRRGDGFHDGTIH